MLGKKHLVAAGLGLAIALTNTVVQAQGGDRTYKVEVTNILGAGQFTPILAVVHAPEVRLFELGEAPSDGLAELAEGGNNAPLVASLSGLKEVALAQSFTPADDAPLTLAGSTTEFEISVPANFRFISLAAMILPTNDSFFALDTVPLPNARPRAFFAKGYDAGSEVNDELCVNIPGPTCGGDGAFTEVNGEGFVHISRGISGEGGLSSAEYDWRNPVAKVVISRIK